MIGSTVVESKLKKQFNIRVDNFLNKKHLYQNFLNKKIFFLKRYFIK